MQTLQRQHESRIDPGGQQMGLFGPSNPLDEDLRRALIGDSGSDRKVVAKAQAAIRSSLRSGEPVRAIAVDQFMGWPMLVVTDRRLMVMDRGGKSLQKSLDPEQIDQAAPAASGLVRVLTDDGDLAVRLRDYACARMFVRAVNDSLLSRRPRTIPTLYPKFFLELLAAADTPATPTNVSRFVERVFVMIKGQANVFFQQLDEPAAQAEFNNHFDGGGPEDRVLNCVDDMIDWLWKWNPACHRPLERTVRSIHDGLLMPHSFLHTNGGDITPWSEWASKA
ncbi:hypothetical protein [Micromonospora sp. M61]|uniref:hypothetical protein n=1 Tax=Micromonospora sp. M61 TaxID=2824890 RepID=UPI001B37758F|nr:hypothetical protein [Micromonospora sp. M61]MBQ0977864.1 hypothetical protein [Micromonospora sp. M61]